jgi:hypothetical protein
MRLFFLPGGPSGLQFFTARATQRAAQKTDLGCPKFPFASWSGRPRHTAAAELVTELPLPWLPLSQSQSPQWLSSPRQGWSPELQFFLGGGCVRRWGCGWVGAGAIKQGQWRVCPLSEAGQLRAFLVSGSCAPEQARQPVEQGGGDRGENERIASKSYARRR